MLTLFQAEFWKQARLYQSYTVQLIADQVFFIIGFLLIAGLFDLVTDNHFDGWARLSSLIGYLTWRVAGGCMAETSGTVAEDAQAGTLEQVWLTGQNPALLLLVRGLVLVIYYSARVLVMAVIIMPLMSIPLPFTPGVILIYLLTLLGAFGLAYMITGLHLIYKNASALTMPLATILLFLTGAMVSLEGIPTFYEASRFLPLSIGIDLMRDIMVHGISWLTAVRSPAFVALLINSAVYLISGLMVLAWAQKKAQAAGSLAHY